MKEKYGIEGLETLDHIAMAVWDIEQAAQHYVDRLQAEIIHREEVPSQGVSVLFLRCADSAIELISPLSPDTAVHRFLEKRGPGFHHIAFRVADIHQAYRSLSDAGLRLLQEPVRGARNKLVFFIHPKDMDGVLTEICSYER